MSKKNNIIDLIPCAIAGLIAAMVTDDLNLIQKILVAIIIGFIIGILWLLGKKLLAYMNK